MATRVAPRRRAVLSVTTLTTDGRLTSLLSDSRGSDMATGTTRKPSKALPPLDAATGWLNTAPLRPEDLRGKVVVANFWTFTCINWLRQLPYLRAWHAAYSDRGLLLVGVHTPEFGFERAIDNVARAVTEMQIRYPVALDSDYGVWNAFSNRYWPALYFADGDGNLRHRHFGEGGYSGSERLIRQLLTASGATDLGPPTVPVIVDAAEAPADWANLSSRETYVGYTRSTHFASPGGLHRDGVHIYTAPDVLLGQQWALTGRWTIEEESIRSQGRHGSVSNRFHARDLHLVMGPSTPATGQPFRVLIDGKSPGSSHGDDVDELGFGTLDQQRLYQLVRQDRGPVGDRTFEILFPETGAQVFAFTYG